MLFLFSEGLFNPLLVNPPIGWVAPFCRIIKLSAISDGLFGGLILCLQVLVYLNLNVQGAPGVYAGQPISMPSTTVISWWGVGKKATEGKRRGS